MSRYEWEAGTLIISVKAWGGFKRALREEYDRLQALRYELANALAADLKELGRGRRNFNFAEAAGQLFPKKAQGRFSPVAEDYYVVIQSIFPGKDGDEAGKRVRPRAPKKKDFPAATAKTVSFEGEDWTITLDDKVRTFEWDVSENNHACERAHQDPLPTAAFKALDRMLWTRQTGGVITGNDEYNEESKDEGGAGNYVVRRYGPLGEDPEFRRLRRRRGERSRRRR